MTEFAALVLFSAHLDRMAAFYRAVGLELDDEDHGDGARHLAGDVGTVHFAIFAADGSAGGIPHGAPRWRQPGSSFPGFWVESLDDTVAALTELGAPVVTVHQAQSWGCRAVVEDPDGRAVEINQRDHCPG